MESNKITETIAKHLGVAPADVDPEASLQDDLGLGPIELADLLNELSTKFQITFNPSEVEGLQTVEDLIAMVEDALLE